MSVNISILNKCCSFEFSIHQRILIKNDHSFLKNIKPFSTLIIYQMFLERHNRMISEGSCDTEDWSNDAEN